MPDTADTATTAAIIFAENIDTMLVNGEEDAWADPFIQVITDTLPSLLIALQQSV